jgi:hypothetical protein
MVTVILLRRQHSSSSSDAVVGTNNATPQCAEWNGQDCSKMIESRQPAPELGAFLGLVIHGRCDNKKLKRTSNAEYHENDNFKNFADALVETN